VHFLLHFLIEVVVLFFAVYAVALGVAFFLLGLVDEG
jgi:hypothetical protein